MLYPHDVIRGSAPCFAHRHTGNASAAARALGATLIELSVMAEHRIEAPAPERVRIALD
jgi:hypothetical protein